MNTKISDADWPEYLMIRDTELHDDLGGLGQRIYTTAGSGYKKVKYVRADLPHLAAEAVPDVTTGHCANKRRPGGCHLNNLQCGYPTCDRKAVSDTHPQPAALNEVSGNSGELGEQRGVYIGMPVGERTVARAVASLQQSLTFAQDFRAEDVRVVLAALAATGKQQGGEVQGDTLATLQQDYANLLAAFDRQVAAAEKIATTALEQDDRIEELEEALAARQPVGQEPKFELRICEVKHTVLRPNRTYSFTVDPNCAACRAQAAYAVGHSAPPAQGIELSPIATRKLAELAAQGYITNGVAIFNPATGHRGLVDNLGFVGWLGAQGIDLGGD